MTENRKKRYPSDRLKLHVLLEKRKKELAEMQTEVAEIEELARQADRTAIHATAELYRVTPEQLAELMQKVYGKPGARVVPELPEGVTEAPAKEEESIDDE